MSNIIDTFNKIFIYNVYKYVIFNNKIYNINELNEDENNNLLIDNNNFEKICKKYDSYNEFIKDNPDFDLIIFKNSNNDLLYFNEFQLINNYLFVKNKNYILNIDNIKNYKINNLDTNLNNLLYRFINNIDMNTEKILLNNFSFNEYNKKSTSVIFKFDNTRGYGDFIRGLMTSFLISILTNKNLYIDTNSPYKKLLDLPLISNINKSYTYNLDLFEYMINRNTQHVQIIEKMNLNNFFNGKNIIIKTNTCILSLLKKNSHYNIKTIIQIMDYIYKKFYEIFKPIFNINLTENNYIGIHIRCGDKYLVKNIPNYKFKNDTRIKDLNDIDIQLIKLKYFYPNQKFFLCSDNNHVYETAKNIFEENLIHNNIVQNIHSTFINDTNISLLQHMIKEHYYLTKAKYLITTKSQFSLTASLIGGIPLFFINDYMFQNYDVLLQMNL